MKLIDNPPSDVLVQWAGATGLVQHAWDRPWLQAPIPEADVPGYALACRCKMAVHMLRHRCSDGKGCVFLGQCARCSAIVWTYRAG